MVAIKKKRKDGSLSIRMPLVLQEQIPPAVRTASAKNQTVFIAGAIKALLRRIHDGVVVSDLTTDQCSIGSAASMINFRTDTDMLTVLDLTAMRFYQSTTKLVLWAVALAVQEQGIRLDTTVQNIQVPKRISVPDEVAVLWERATKRLKLQPEQYLQYATDQLLTAIDQDVAIRALGLPRDAFEKTTRNVPTLNPTFQTLTLDPETTEKISTTAPRLYHTFSSFVLWAGCWVAFRVQKMS